MKAKAVTVKARLRCEPSMCRLTVANHFGITPYEWSFKEPRPFSKS